MLGNLFDPTAELLIQDRMRPHWDQAGAIVYITARTDDSIPRKVLQLWDREKNEWLKKLATRLGIPPPRGRYWKDILKDLDDQHRRDFLEHFNRLLDMELDTCHGACWLKKPEFAQIVADSLLHFDGVRYRMGDFVIMPNHLHLLAAFGTPGAMKSQVDSWLHWTATQINRRTGIRGHFWQQEPFDHLVRSVEQYEYLRNYIRDNPKKAGLREGETIYRRLDE